MPTTAGRPDERPADDLEVLPLEAADAPTALALLQAAEAAAGGDLVDEAERRRLDAAARDPGVAADLRWRPVVALAGDVAVGYGALLLPTAAVAARDAGAEVVTDAVAVGDAAAVPDAGDPPAVLAALLTGLADAARQAGVPTVQVWCRQVGQRHLDAAAAAGFDVHRRLGVLGRRLPVGDPRPADAGVPIRGYRDGDDAAVVRVLADAYAGTDDGGWTLEAFRIRTGWDWFRGEDLLVAEDPDQPGRLLGVHWTKRRTATQGEVHNLAVHPDAQGRGLGPLLLRAGLDHLAGVGCDEVVLWVDRANARAVAMYERAGFTTRWDDVALTARVAAR